MTTETVIEVKELALDDLLSKGVDLFKAHHKEVAHYQQDFDLEIDTLRYKAIDQKGDLLVIGAMLGKKLVGYSVNVIAPMSHYARTLCCFNDAIFVDRKFRSGGVGTAIIKETEALAKAKFGCDLLLIHGKPKTRITLLLPNMGYDKFEITFSKRL